MSTLPTTKYPPTTQAKWSEGSPKSEPGTDLFQIPLSRPQQRSQDVRNKIQHGNSGLDFTGESEQDQPLAIGIYPKPLVIQPLLEHRQTFVLLHGRGGNAIEFGYNLLATQIFRPEVDIAAAGISQPIHTSLLSSNTSDSQFTLKEAFPHAKFIFPTAAPRRAKVYGRKPIFQWMDNWPLSRDFQTHNQIERDDSIQVPGLKASIKYIHDLLRAEIEIVGIDNLVLGGLSQGCACALVSLLTWSGPRIPLMFGMCGWLPFAQELEQCSTPDDAYSAEDDLFEREPSDEDHVTELQLGQRLIGELCDILEWHELPGSLGTSIFLGHGSLDETVPIQNGEDAARILTKMTRHDSKTSIDNSDSVEWQRYEGLGHWYSGEMLHDIVHFIKSKTEWS